MVKYKYCTNKVPIVICDSYEKLVKYSKQNNNLKIIPNQILRKILFNFLFVKELGKGNFGGNRRGLKRDRFPKHVEDMITFRTIKKINRNEYELLDNEDALNRITPKIKDDLWPWY